MVIFMTKILQQWKLKGLCKYVTVNCLNLLVGREILYYQFKCFNMSLPLVLYTEKRRYFWPINLHVFVNFGSSTWTCKFLYQHWMPLIFGKFKYQYFELQFDLNCCLCPCSNTWFDPDGRDRIAGAATPPSFLCVPTPPQRGIHYGWRKT